MCNFFLEHPVEVCAHAKNYSRNSQKWPQVRLDFLEKNPGIVVVRLACRCYDTPNCILTVVGIRK